MSDQSRGGGKSPPRFNPLVIDPFSGSVASAGGSSAGLRYPLQIPPTTPGNASRKVVTMDCAPLDVIDAQNLSLPEPNSDVFLVGNTQLNGTVYALLTETDRKTFAFEVITISNKGQTRQKKYTYETRTEALKLFFALASKIDPLELMVASYGQLFPLGDRCR